MTSRLLPAALALAIVATMTSGCLPQPDPEPSPAFSSEEEAFAAAEATYRAYVDALNQVDLSDPETFEEVYAWTTGDANAGARESFSQMHADGWSVDGVSTVTSVEELSTATPDVAISLFACLDVSDVGLTDETGASVVDPARPNTQEVQVDLVDSSDSPTGLLITRLDGYDGRSCA